MTHPTDETTTAPGAATALLIDLERAAGVPEAQPPYEIRIAGRRRYLVLVHGERLCHEDGQPIEYPSLELAQLAATQAQLDAAPFSYDTLKAANDRGALPALLATLNREELIRQAAAHAIVRRQQGKPATPEAILAGYRRRLLDAAEPARAA